MNEAPIEILLDHPQAMENLQGLVIGRVSVRDQDVQDTHRLNVNDVRFELVESELRLKPQESLSLDSGDRVVLSVTAIDSGAKEITQSIVITVLPNPFPWQNSLNRLDVNDDQFVAPIDVLLVINELNLPTVAVPEGKLPRSRPADVRVFWDVMGDGVVAPIDALEIVNAINELKAAGKGPPSQVGFLDTTLMQIQLTENGGRRLNPLRNPDSPQLGSDESGSAASRESESAAAILSPSTVDQFFTELSDHVMPSRRRSRRPELAGWGTLP